MPSIIAFLCYYAVTAFKDRLKKSRRIVLFKRNTLGMLRYRLSPAIIVKACKRLHAIVQRRGWIIYLQDSFHDEQSILLCYKDKIGAPCDLKYLAKEAKPCDAPELALLMNCAPEEVIKRFYRMQQCFVLKRGDSIYCAAWISNSKEQIEISDCCIDKRFCCEQDLILLLNAILRSLRALEHTPIILKMNFPSIMFVHAAYQTGFKLLNKQITA
jgi:hypothetical protein